MRKLIFTLAWIILATPSYAQLTATGVGGGFGVSAGGAYVGPCEVSGVNCVAFYAVEACATNAYAGNTVDVVDTATGNTTGTRLSCASGVVSAVVSGSACTFVTGNACSSLATTCATSCVFKTIYNQSGTGTFPNLIDAASLSNRLTITQSALNSKACFTGNGSQYAHNSVATATLAQPLTVAAVAKRTGSFTSTQSIHADGNTQNIGYRASTNTVGSISGTITATATDNVYNSIMEVSASGAGNSVMVVNGAAGTTGTLTGSYGGGNSGYFGAFTNAPTSALTGSICEVIITNNALNATQYGALNTNQRASNRWGNSF